MPIAENSLANLQPAWNSKTVPRNTTRRSRDTDRTFRLARKGCPDAMLYTLDVLRDTEQHVRYRLKAAEIVLEVGMPKNGSTQVTIGEGGALLRIEIVDPQKIDSSVGGAVRANGHGVAEPVQISFSEDDNA